MNWFKRLCGRAVREAHEYVITVESPWLRNDFIGEKKNMWHFDFERYDGTYVYCASSGETKHFIETVGHEARRRHSTLYFNGYEVSDYPVGIYYFYMFDNAHAEIRLINFVTDYIFDKSLKWSDFMKDKKFTKSDLKNGDVVKRRGGRVEIACVNTGTLIARDGFDYLCHITEDLIYNNGSDTYPPGDIVAIRRPDCPSDCRFAAFDEFLGTLVYDRERDDPDIVDMTMEDVCKALGKRVKIVDGK